MDLDLRYFSPETDPRLFKCPCGDCDKKPTKELLLAVDAVRALSGTPMVVSSGPRCRHYNHLIGGTAFSEHLDGDGADIRCQDSRSRMLIIAAAVKVGINRIGVAKGFVHLGVSRTNDHNVMWVY